MVHQRGAEPCEGPTSDEPCSLPAALRWAEGRDGIPVRLELEPGVYLETIHLDESMKVSELVLSCVAEECVLESPSHVSAGTTVFEGLTWRGLRQAAVVVSGGSLEMRRCTLEHQHGEGALHVFGGDVIFQDGLMTNNSASDMDYGGCVTSGGGQLAVHGSNVTDNKAVRGGAFLLMEDARVHLTSTRVANNRASERGGAFEVSGGALVLSDGSLLEDNEAGGTDMGHSIAVGAGAVYYALPAPTGRWVSSSFLCEEYRYPCPPGDVGCDPDAQPALDNQPCDHTDPLLMGKTIAALMPGEKIDDDYPFACPPGVFGSDNIASSQKSPSCSGACPAGHSCALATVTPELCPPTAYCPTGSAEPIPCPGGTTSETPGLTSVEDCEPCPAGSWCTAGRRVPCVADQYNPNAAADDQSFCLPCPAESFTQGEGTVSLSGCMCKAGYFARWQGETLTCETCPIGSNCTAPAQTLEALSLNEGFWRASPNTTDVRRCQGFTLGSVCAGCIGEGCVPGLSHQYCREGLTGPMCGLCVDNPDESVFFDSRRRACRLCSEHGFVVPIVLAGVLIVSLTFCLIGRKLHSRRSVRQNQSELESRVDPDRSRRDHGVKELIRREGRWWQRHAKSVKNRLKIKLKIAWSFYQIVTRVGDTYQIAFPPTVERSIKSFDWVNFELDALGVPPACLGLRSYEDKLLLVMLAPLALLLGAKCIGWVQRDRSHERALVSTAAPGARHSVFEMRGKTHMARARVALRQSTYAALPFALRVTFVVFPVVSSLCFRALRCTDLDENDLDADGLPKKSGVMIADYAVQCWDDDGYYTYEYLRIRLLAWIGIIAYPVCVPLVYIVLYCKVRHVVWRGETNRLSRSMTFLTGEYSDIYFFWEFVEVIKKLLLIGLLSIDLPGAPVGSINQLVIANLVTLCFLVALMTAKPHKRPEDDVIALATSFALALFFFFSLILRVQTLTEAISESLIGTELAKSFAIDNNTNAALLISATFGALAVGAFMIFVELTATAVAETQRQRKEKALQNELQELRKRERATGEEKQAMLQVLADEVLPKTIQHCLISKEDLDLSDKVLGTGSFAEVWLASWKGVAVAVKKLHRSKLDDANLRAFRAEFELQLSLPHPNIVQVLGGCWSLEDINVFMVMELCEHGTLESLLATDPRRMELSWAKHKLHIATGLARAMHHLHSQSPPIIHRDIKPENVLVDSGFNAKLGDFGCGREVDTTKTMELAGTPLYSAPEVLRREQYNEKADVWSFACCLESLWTHEHVYQELLRPDTHARALRMSLEDGVWTQASQMVRAEDSTWAMSSLNGNDILLKIQREEIRPQICHVAFEELVRDCSVFDYEERLTSTTVLEMLSDPSLVRDAIHIAPGPAQSDLPRRTGEAVESSVTKRATDMVRQKTLPAPSLAAELSRTHKSSARSSSEEKISEPSAGKTLEERKAELKAADSSRSLLGHKESPPREVSVHRRASLGKMGVHLSVASAPPLATTAEDEQQLQEDERDGPRRPESGVGETTLDC